MSKHHLVLILVIVFLFHPFIKGCGSLMENQSFEAVGDQCVEENSKLAEELEKCLDAL